MDLNDSSTEKRLFRRHAVAEFARRLGEIVHRAPSYLRERITPTPKNRFVDLLPNIKKEKMKIFAGLPISCSSRGPRE